MDDKFYKSALGQVTILTVVVFFTLLAIGYYGSRPSGGDLRNYEVAPPVSEQVRDLAE